LLHALINWYTRHFPFPFRGWKYAQRLLAATGQNDRLFIKKIHNGQLVQVCPREHIQQQLFWYGFYEKTEVLAWESLITPNATVLDIGANIGYYSLVAAPRAAKGRVFAFEPQASPLSRLRKNIDLNRLTNLIAIPLGVSDAPGSATLYLAGASNEGMGSLRKGEDFSAATETIQLVRLDDWCRENGVHPDFIKMDIEGAEYNALLGMNRVLREDRPVLFIEIDGNLLARFGRMPADVHEYLRSLSYSAYGIKENSRFEKMNVPGEGELVVFVPEEKGHLVKA